MTADTRFPLSIFVHVCCFLGVPAVSYFVDPKAVCVALSLSVLLLITLACTMAFDACSPQCPNVTSAACAAVFGPNNRLQYPIVK